MVVSRKRPSKHQKQYLAAKYVERIEEGEVLHNCGERNVRDILAAVQCEAFKFLELCQMLNHICRKSIRYGMKTQWKQGAVPLLTALLYGERSSSCNHSRRLSLHFLHTLSKKILHLKIKSQIFGPGNAPFTVHQVCKRQETKDDVDHLVREVGDGSNDILILVIFFKNRNAHI